MNAEIKEQLNRKSIRYNWHEADVTVLEGIFARGDRKVAKALRLAYEKGCLFDSWTEHFHNELWLAAFEEAGVDTDFTPPGKESWDEVFPWDFIDIGVTRKFLQREWERAHEKRSRPTAWQAARAAGPPAGTQGSAREVRPQTSRKEVSRHENPHQIPQIRRHEIHRPSGYHALFPESHTPGRH